MKNQFFNMRSFILLLALIFTLYPATAGTNQKSAGNEPVSFAQATTTPVYDIRDFKSFSEAVTAIGTNQAVLQVSNEQLIQQTVTVPATIVLQFVQPGLLNIASGVSVTIQGTIQADLYQIFSGAGLVTVANTAMKAYPQWWGAKVDGVTEDTQPVQRAIESKTRAGGGEVYFVNGTYVVNGIELDSNITITGQGWDAIIKQKSGARFGCSINPYSGGTPNPADNKHDITIRNIQFRGTVDVDGFSEHFHLLNINAATKVTISKCKFAGWRGDAIYVGSSNAHQTERHNKQIVIEDSVFDGINKDNRNAISIIDGEGIEIKKNSFMNCTRSNMPGAVDLEPNPYTFGIIKNIAITNNTFSNIGGFVGVVAFVMQVSQANLTTPSNKIVIQNNVIDNGSGNSSNADGIMLYQIQDVTDSTLPNDIVVSNNFIKNVNRPFKLLGVKGIKLTSNTFEKSLKAGTIGATRNCQDVDIFGNVFRDLGMNDGVGLDLYNIKGIKLRNNIFDNVGLMSGTRGYAIHFNAGTAAHIRIEKNIFQGYRTTGSIQRSESNVTLPGDNVIINNVFKINKGNFTDLYNQ